MKTDERQYCDILIIGSGIAGLSCAITAADLGLEVIIINKEASIEESNTFYAQGGIVARGQDDTPELLSDDIMQAGDGISNPEAVKIVAYEGPGMVEDFLIKKVGVTFSRSGEDEFEFAREASHSRRRILHSKDSTGKAIEAALVAKLAEYSNIRAFPGYTAIDLLTIPHNSTSPLALYREPQCIGAYVLNNGTGNVERFFSSYTVLATGGLGRIYLHTTNPPIATGDGFAMA
ncbi:MAG TPA: L-aspartate oxidase, partial [Deltaproteobacteria bacterium]|nr:L-aspartate oxidase [Deltaproteobacteria bacterium]